MRSRGAESIKGPYFFVYAFGEFSFDFLGDVDGISHCIGSMHAAHLVLINKYIILNSFNRLFF